MPSIFLSRCCTRRLASSTRGLATRAKSVKKVSPQVLEALPVFSSPSEAASPARTPVTSAHAIDVAAQQVSVLDSAAVSPDGSVVHGTYGKLPDASAAAVPLEYLALLRPAAEGCAALRMTAAKSPGTLLIYGAGHPSGLAAAQVASSQGHAVVAVLGSDHSGNEQFGEALKGMLAEPGTVVPENYALSKKRFADLVNSIVSGNDGTAAAPDTQAYLNDFKQNFVEQCRMYPDTRPAAVSEKHLKFEYMEREQAFWEENMEAYLEQFPPGAPPVDQAKLDALFTPEQYEIFRKKFWQQTTNVISGVDTPFSAPHIVQQLLHEPQTLSGTNNTKDSPYAFSILENSFPQDTNPAPGGPIVGAIICATPDLQIASQQVAQAGNSIRAKAEALQFLTTAQKASYGAACSVVAQARAANAPVTVVGGLPLADLKEAAPVTATEADVQTALQAMDVQEDGSTALNFFVQTYRAVDFPFYADYAVHQASEEMAGPRQIVVTK